MIIACTPRSLWHSCEQLDRLNRTWMNKHVCYVSTLTRIFPREAPELRCLRRYLLTQHNVRGTELSQWFRAGLTSPWAGASIGTPRLQSSSTQEHPNCQTTIYIQPHRNAPVSCFRSKQFPAHRLDHFILTCFDNLFHSAQVEEARHKLKTKQGVFLLPLIRF